MTANFLAITAIAAAAAWTSFIGVLFYRLGERHATRRERAAHREKVRALQRLHAGDVPTFAAFPPQR